MDGHGVCRALAENVELALKMLRVERAGAGRPAVTVVGAKDDERLEDRGLLAGRGGPEDGAVGRDLAPAEDAEAEVTRELGKHRLLLLQADGVVRLEKDVADGVLAELRKLAAKVALGLALEELVGDTGHDTRTIAVPTVRASSTTVGHRAEELASIGNDLVAVVALDVADEADTAGVLFVVVHVEALACGESGVP